MNAVTDEHVSCGDVWQSRSGERLAALRKISKQYESVTKSKATRGVSRYKSGARTRRESKAAMNCRNPKYNKAARGAPHSKSARRAAHRNLQDIHIHIFCFVGHFLWMNDFIGFIMFFHKAHVIYCSVLNNMTESFYPFILHVLPGSRAWFVQQNI